MHSPTITIPHFPSLRTTFTFPVHSLKGHAPKGVFAALRKTTKLVVTLEAAVVYAKRYLFNGTSLPTQQTVDDWANLLRWELGTFWAMQPSRAVAETAHGANPLSFSFEHGNRSGEYLACGLALALVDSIRIPPSRAMFYAASGSRPDFVLPFFTLSGRKVGVEAKCRGYEATPDTKALTAISKKKTFGEVLCVIFNHGEPLKKRSRVTNSKAATRLLLIDPDGESESIGRSVMIETVLRNYKFLVTSIGLHYYEERIVEALRMIENGIIPRAVSATHPSFDAPSVQHPQHADYGNQRYIGRRFSSLVAESTFIGRAEVTARVGRGELGSYSFRGINSVVLDMLDRWDWDGLLQYHDPQFSLGLGEKNSGATVCGDGFAENTLVVTDADSEQGRDIRTSLNLS